MPLVVWHSSLRGAPARLSATVRVTHLDLLPTIVSLAAHEAGATPAISWTTTPRHGSDLLPLLLPPAQVGKQAVVHAYRSRLENRSVYVEVGVARALLVGAWKLIAVAEPTKYEQAAGCIDFQGRPMGDYLAKVRRSRAPHACMRAWRACTCRAREPTFA